MNWMPELESALKSVKNPVRKQRANPVGGLLRFKKNIRAQSKGHTNLLLFFLFLSLTVIFAGVYRWKDSRVVSPLPPKVQREKPQFVNPAPDLSEYDRKIDALTSQADKLVADVRANNDKITLTGILLNNNFVGNSKGLKNYIYLNHDWTINRLPDQLTLDEQDIEFLNGKLRKTKEGDRWNKKVLE